MTELRRGHAGTPRHLYAILDLAAASDAPHWYRRLTNQWTARSLFDGQPEASAREQAPWLIALDGEDLDTVLRHTVAEAMASQSVCWLESTLAIDPLAWRLARRTSVRLNDGDALLRYYDARLFPAFWGALEPDQRAAFGALGERWCCLDQDMVLQNIVLPGVVDVDSFVPPWQASPTQIQTLIDLSERHQLIDFLAKRRPDDFLDMDRGQRFRFVARHDAAARGRQISDFADRLRYCELALEHGDDFADQPAWQPVWQEIATRGTGLRAACAQLRQDVTV